MYFLAIKDSCMKLNRSAFACGLDRSGTRSQSSFQRIGITYGLKVSPFELRSSWLDFCPFRGPGARHTLIESIPGKKTCTQAFMR